MINLITGCMFAGKTSLAIKQSDQVGSCMYFKPAIDNRYSADNIVTHDRIKRPAMVLKNMTDCDNYFLNSKLSHCILIDELQFFEPFIIQAIKEAHIMGYDVYVTSLNYWADDCSFKRLVELRNLLKELEIDNETKLKARCHYTGKPAEFSFKISGDLNELVDVGGADKYIPVSKQEFRRLRREQIGK